jgi:cation diffusion facilitator CzcD-associated flavoprotein CzcO
MSDLPKVCIIGAGSSGIAAAKIFHERGVPFDCLERGDRVGGNWVFKNKNGMSSAYRSLHINTSKTKMAFSDFPMPAEYPDFPHHPQVARYFDAYVDHFGFRNKIRFNAGVARASLDAERLWHVTLQNGETRSYDALCVASGHHWSARWPEPRIPGTFDGLEMHSHDYIDPTEPFAMRGKRIVIVGFGNSALDIACELGRKEVCEEVHLSARRGYWVMPRYFGSLVFDFAVPHPSRGSPLRLVPRPLAMAAMQLLITLVAGRPQDHGLQAPDHRFGATHPVISHEIYDRIGSGDVIPKLDIKRFEGKRVVFADESSVEADIVIYCTGYNISFPFLDPSIISTADNEIALWQRMIDPKTDNLFFIGLIQPLCASMPLAEEQSKLVAAYLAADYLLPSRDEMEIDRIESYRRNQSNFIKTTRHTIEVDCPQYVHDLRQEICNGRKRAKFLGNPSPVKARAAKLAAA